MMCMSLLQSSQSLEVSFGCFNSTKISAEAGFDSGDWKSDSVKLLKEGSSSAKFEAKKGKRE